MFRRIEKDKGQLSKMPLNTATGMEREPPPLCTALPKGMLRARQNLYARPPVADTSLDIGATHSYMEQPVILREIVLTSFSLQVLVKGEFAKFIDSLLTSLQLLDLNRLHTVKISYTNSEDIT